jgi:hypothetical protein
METLEKEKHTEGESELVASINLQTRKGNVVIVVIIFTIEETLQTCN